MIAICGATGNIGAEVVRLLLEQNQSVRVLVRDAKKVSAIESRVQVAVADLMKPETLRAAFAGCRKRSF
jgi:uncharacterized protein YbjT (DUF2867 family)